ncbi:DUF5330 domain-containing protein [Allorhizobium undicola]|uniref:DUF5330 domain-containing protein n=1 Tax=Allorhizobium undicola TaxID=78527 RepID=UPI00047FBE46|nr:DUF5330 domain-containing protein [Allorhizobium undicola]
MWFLIKGTFWFTLVLVVLSYMGSPEGENSAATPSFDMANAIVAVTGAYDYARGLCEEKPDVCEKGSQTLHAIGVRAREGALVAYQFLNRQFGEGEAPAPIATPPAAARHPREDAAAPHGIAQQGLTQQETSDALLTGSTASGPMVISIPKPKPKPAG